MKRWITIFTVLMLLLTAALPAMAQGKQASGRDGFAEAGLRDIIYPESSTEAAQESGGFSMWDLTLIGLGICGALLTIMLIIALTSKKEVDHREDGWEKKK